MPVITLLEPQKRNDERINVYLDGEFAFGLNVLDAAGLHTGQQLSEAEIATLHRQDAIVKAVDAAVNLLSYRPRSTHEIRDRLQRKNFDDGVIEVAIERLTTLGYLNDRDFARLWIESRNRSKPRGVRALRYELRRKGIADSIIRELLENMVDEESGAYEAARPRLNRMRGKTRRVFKQKIGAFLQRRGFNYESASQAVDRHMEEIDQTDPDFFAEPEGAVWD